ncbi:MAG: DUF3293 domain-containing protein [Aquabacterium sp.]|uniref:DUF3293 domain-containing protein n=1 Tax=Aquabacterium sp. TaxID=1872578 RepID=UPI0025C134E5|nr:DUF3293 domain-containing protein [Aquabacterium sp.]MBI3380975.1 DUF3293 domain-containing protein [Aquabacterium sp.]
MANSSSNLDLGDLQYMLSICGETVSVDFWWPVVSLSNEEVTVRTPSGNMRFPPTSWPGGCSMVMIPVEEVDEFINSIKPLFRQAPSRLISLLADVKRRIEASDNQHWDNIARVSVHAALSKSHPHFSSPLPFTPPMQPVSNFILIDRPTALPLPLVQAYLETEYRVAVSPEFGVIMPFVLRVGQPSEPLQQLLNDTGAQGAAFVTAFNPYSEVSSAEENSGRQDQLLTTLRQHEVKFLRGQGQHPSNNWPPEPSVLALDLPLDATKRLGMRFQQNALLWCGTDAVPHLVLLM